MGLHRVFSEPQSSRGARTQATATLKMRVGVACATFCPLRFRLDGPRKKSQDLTRVHPRRLWQPSSRT